MAISLCSALAIAALLQDPSAPAAPAAPAAPVPPASDSLAALRTRLVRDSTDAAAWLLVGRAYLRRADDAHAPVHRPPQDSAWARALLDTADQALVRAAALFGPAGSSAPGDSARVLRLRACPMWGVLLTAADADSYAAWYMRFARGLRPDLVAVPLAAWRSDAALRARLAQDLRLGRRAGADAWLPELVERRPVCVSMAL